MNKSILIGTLLSISFLSFSQIKPEQEKLTWYTDVMQAYDISKSTHKPIFAFFTGSDWCGWCHKLQREVLTKPEFVEWAKNNVVLLELDFPRQKQLPAELVQQNQSLQQFFSVTGFPTIWMFFMERNPDDKKINISALGSLGYPQGAQQGHEEVKFLSDANKILANYNAQVAK